MHTEIVPISDLQFVTFAAYSV